jgi:preprotein translocase subunit SecF
LYDFFLVLDFIDNFTIMFIVQYRKFFFALSIVFVTVSLWAGLSLSPRFATDFTGGSILEVSYIDTRPSLDEARNLLSSLDLGAYSIRPSGEQGFVMRTREISLEEKNTIVNLLSSENPQSLREERFNSVGPIVGESLKQKSYYALAVVILCIVLFITFAFRRVSKPVASWKYGFATIVSLVHDVVAATGAFIIYGYFTGAEIDILFVTALLAILGYSVHDTIVVFDRVREHLGRNQEKEIQEDFEKTVGDSLRETFTRSINTSLTMFIVLLVLYMIGSEATRHFSFILLIGVVIGTYSSLFLGTPLLVTLAKFQSKIKSAN